MSGATCALCGVGSATIRYAQMEGYVPQLVAFSVCRSCYRRITMFLFVVGSEGVRGVATPAHPEWSNPWYGVQPEDEPTELWGRE